MKRILLALAFVAIAVVSRAQTPLPDEFFGLKFCERYTVEQMKAAVGENGTYFEIDNTEPYEIGSTKYYRYGFENVTYGGRTYDYMLLLNHLNGKFGMAFFGYAADPDNPAVIKKVYDDLRNELSQGRTLTEFPITDHPEVLRLISIESDVMVRLDKYTDGDRITGVELSYVSSWAGAELLLESQYPTIQDTFLGMKMGSKQTAYSIKSAVGYKGEYLNEEYTTNGKKLIFKDIVFAGREWDYGTFYLTEDGSFYMLTVECSLTDWKSDDKKEAQSIYDSYKQKLTDKYGDKEEKDSDEGKYIMWFGNNDMAVMISNNRGKSNGGEYRRYVSIGYFQTEIYDRLSQKSDDEL